jgi:hypothetical protein
MLEDVKPQPRPLSALPVAVWEDHLLPQLTCKEAGRLGCTCEALREVVREHYMALGVVRLTQLRAALTTFPRAREVTLAGHGELWGAGERGALVELLREGGRGRHLAMIRSDEDSSDVVHAALRAGALPSLKGVNATLEYASHRALLSEGLLGGMHELHLKLALPHEGEDQLAALGVVRQLPALTKLELDVSTDDPDSDEEGDQPVLPVQWPAFIPPSLKALSIKLDARSSLPLLRALPGMLGASGAGLERLEIHLPSSFDKEGDERLVHLAQLLRCCSPTLKVFKLPACDDNEEDDEEDNGASELLRVQWADVLAGVSTCRELEVLVLPVIEVAPLFPPGTALARLTELEIRDYEREHPPGAGGMGLWELLASGGLPALFRLTVSLAGRWSGRKEAVRSRVAPAFEAVAGTLMRLNIIKNSLLEAEEDEEAVGYELGVAVGKLQRLTGLKLWLAYDGRVSRAFAQGLAASGGDRPLPFLRRVIVASAIMSNADLLASLLLPSVRWFFSPHSMVTKEDYEPLLLACALRQAGYKHTWAPYLRCPNEVVGAVRAIVLCKLDEEHMPRDPPALSDDDSDSDG